MAVESIRLEALDPLVHERARLAILSALAPVGDLSFLDLKTVVGLTDGNLSVHLRVLADAAYVVIHKSFRGRIPHTEIRLTPRGRKALLAYLRVLEKIIARASG